MLSYNCARCANSTALIYRDHERDLVTECLACEHIETVATSHIGVGEDKEPESLDE